MSQQSNAPARDGAPVTPVTPVTPHHCVDCGAELPPVAADAWYQSVTCHRCGRGQQVVNKPWYVPMPWTPERAATLTSPHVKPHVKPQPQPHGAKSDKQV